MNSMISIQFTEDQARDIQSVLENISRQAQDGYAAVADTGNPYKDLYKDQAQKAEALLTAFNQARCNSEQAYTIGQLTEALERMQQDA